MGGARDSLLSCGGNEAQDFVPRPTSLYVSKQDGEDLRMVTDAEMLGAKTVGACNAG